MTLLPPPPRPHECGPPLVERRVLLPDEWLRPEDRGRGLAHVDHEPPEPGTTWDCPTCRTVWVAELDETPMRGVHAPGRRVWRRAGWWTARRHRRAVARPGEQGGDGRG